MKIRIIIIFLSLSFLTLSKTDSLEIYNLKENIQRLENRVEEVRRDELNYKIEKDILRETFQSNYENVNLIITIVLGIIGVLGYLGIRDINSIKKEYVGELNSLKELKTKFEIKSDEFDIEKMKFESELKKILQENEEQNRKIKFIELKDKVRVHLTEDNLSSALEFANAALEIKNDDTTLLNQKGNILCRLNQLVEATKTFDLALSIDPKNDSLLLNAVEVYHFANDIEKAEKLISQNKELFSKRKLSEFFELFKIFHSGDLANFDLKIKSMVDISNPDLKSQRISNWLFKDALYFAVHLSESDFKTRLQNILWYLDGQISAKTVYDRLGFEIENNTANTRNKK